jgi:hypothetical protein
MSAAPTAVVIHWLASCAIAASACATAASASQQVGFVVEDVLASKVFAALVSPGSTRLGFSAKSGDGGGGGSSCSISSSLLLEALLEVMNPSNLVPICRALARVLLYPNAHPDFARIAGEIAALQTTLLLHLLHTSNRDEDFKAALEDCITSITQRTADISVANACVDQLLLIMCVHANIIISDGRICAEARAISGPARTLCRRRRASQRCSRRGADVASRWTASHSSRNGDLSWAAGDDRCCISCASGGA